MENLFSNQFNIVMTENEVANEINWARALKSYRISLGITQLEMANQLGLTSQQSYQHYEKKLNEKQLIFVKSKLKFDFINNQKIEDLNESDKFFAIIKYFPKKIAILESSISNQNQIDVYESILQELNEILPQKSS